MSNAELVWRQVIQQVREDLRAAGVVMSLEEVEGYCEPVRAALDQEGLLDAAGKLKPLNDIAGRLGVTRDPDSA